MNLGIFAFHGVDVIFEASWLATLGAMLTVYTTRQMDFFRMESKLN